MRVLVGCERFGVIRRALRARGHNAWSCDLEAAEDSTSWHIQGDLLQEIATNANAYDLLIAHPPCQFLSSSGLHWNTRRPERAAQTEAALEFVRALMAAPIPRIAIENPVGCISTRIRKPDDITQPWEFGDDASKATCWWLKGLPKLVRTNVLPGGRKARRANQTASGQNKLGPSPTRAAERARTYPGIAAAIAEQWGSLNDLPRADCFPSVSPRGRWPKKRLPI